MNFNIAIIAGYDVLANKIPVHGHYVVASFLRSMEFGADLIIFVGGATNPDYPNKTEAEANRLNLWKGIIQDRYEIREVEQSEKEKELASLLEASRYFNERRADNSLRSKEKIFSVIKVLPFGNTSAETLKAAKIFIEENKIPMGRLILCAEKARLAGFLYDALEVGLSDLA